MSHDLSDRQGGGRSLPAQTPPLRYNIQYGADSDAAVASDLIIDYDMVRLLAAGSVPVRCAELADLAAEGTGPLDRIFMTVFPYTAKAQLARDFASASRILSAGGLMAVRLTEPRLASSVRRVLASHFVDIRAVSRELLHCRGSREASGALPPECLGTIGYLDPFSGCRLTFATAPSLFSFGEVDAGTELLLDSLGNAGRPARALDIGCGYGAVGSVLAARGMRTTMLDSDWRAVKLARANLAANRLAGDVLVGDASADLPPGPFDLAVSNPPTHAGSARLQRMFDLAAARAASVRIVVRAHLNYEKWLQPRFSTHRVTEQGGFKVIEFARR